MESEESAHAHALNFARWYSRQRGFGMESGEGKVRCVEPRRAPRLPILPRSVWKSQAHKHLVKNCDCSERRATGHGWFSFPFLYNRQTLSLVRGVPLVLAPSTRLQAVAGKVTPWGFQPSPRWYSSVALNIKAPLTVTLSATLIARIRQSELIHPNCRDSAGCGKRGRIMQGSLSIRSTANKETLPIEISTKTHRRQ